MHIWTETHSLLFLPQQAVLQMSSIIPSSLPSHSSTLSPTIMAIAPSGVFFPLLVKFFSMPGEFPIMGHKAQNVRHVFSQPPLQLGSGHVVRLLQSDPPTSQATLWAKSPVGSGSPCCDKWGQWGQRLEYTPSRPLETRQQ